MSDTKLGKLWGIDQTFADTIRCTWSKLAGGLLLLLVVLVVQQIARIEENIQFVRVPRRHMAATARNLALEGASLCALLSSIYNIGRRGAWL